MDDYRHYAVTLSGIAALQIPTLISGAPKGSGLSKFQGIGFPFNMSKNVLRNHFSFSPANISAGRYYTLVTSLFNHAGNKGCLVDHVAHLHRTISSRYRLNIGISILLKINGAQLQAIKLELTCPLIAFTQKPKYYPVNIL